MTLTNNYDLPEWWCEVVAKWRDEYSKEGADFSVTELIDSPYLSALSRCAADQFPEDVTDATEAFIGGAVHDAVEKYQGKRATHERKIVGEFGGFKIKGAMDVFVDGVVWDVKTWAASQRPYLVEGDFRSAEKQLNVYAELLRSEGEEVTGLRLLIPWKRLSALQRSPKDPPHSPEVFEVPLWSAERARGYLLERIELHARARATADIRDIPSCTDEERWFKPGGFAVQAAGSSRAHRVLDSHAEAEAIAREMNAKQAGQPPSKRKFYTFSERPSTYRRCDSYCRFRSICKEYSR